MSKDTPRAIRFVRAQVDVLAEHCEAVVEVTGQDEATFIGTAQGGITETDQLRAVARATSDALTDAFETQGAKVRVIGVQLVDAVAQTAVVVSLATSAGAHTKTLLGISDGTSDPAKATALAVLNATNRFLGRGA